ncbi:MAG TPA: YceI family protein [Gammaproteobacteria bacterium]|nr:YceI family protein [Gammaproteobacteria bacterium]
MKKLLSGLALLALPMISFAAVPSWNIVPSQSSLSFSATQNGAPVKGEFKTFTGDIQGTPEDLKNSHVKIMVDLGSVSTTDKDVSNTLKTADWFDITHFPKATFIADNFTKTGGNTYTAAGKLTIRDKTIPVTLNFVLKDYSGNTLDITGTTTLQRTAFGVGQGDWSKTDSIKDKVAVQFTLKASKA